MALVGLVRVSTQKQETARQHDALDPICARVFEERPIRRLAVDHRPGLKAALDQLGDGDMLVVQDVVRLGRNTLEGLIVLNDLFERGLAVKVLEGAAAGEHTKRSVLLDIALALAEDRRIVRKPKYGPESVRKLGKVGGSPRVLDADKRAAILARIENGDSIRLITRVLGVSVGTVNDVRIEQAAAEAVSLRPIPPEAIRSGGSAAVHFAAQRDQRFWNCVECGRECVPELNWADGHGVRIVYVCPQHGVHSVVDPFEDMR